MKPKVKKTKKVLELEKTVRSLKKEVTALKYTAELANKIIFALVQKHPDHVYSEPGKEVLSTNLKDLYLSFRDSESTFSWEIDRDILLFLDVVSACRKFPKPILADGPFRDLDSGAGFEAYPYK